MLLSDLLFRNADLRPTAAAVTDAHRELSWSEFDHEVRSLGAAMLALGLEKGDRVAVVMPNRAELVIAAMACFHTGTAFTPLNYHSTVVELDALLRDARPRLLLVDSSAFPALAEQAAKFAGEVGATLVDVAGRAVGGRYGDLPHAAPLARWQAYCGPTDPAALIYTGGSTGQAKGVLLSHRSWVHSSRDELWSLGWTCDDVMLQYLPMFHTSFVHYVTACLAGAHTVLRRRTDAEELVGAVQRDGVTATHMVLANLVDLIRLLEERPADVSGLRSVVYGGSSIPAGVIERAQAVLGDVLTQFYGQTEAGGAVAVLRPADHRVPPDGSAARLSSAGRPMPTVSMRIDRDDSFGDGAGEILVRSEGVMLEYWRRPELTAATLDKHGWLHTGDVGLFDADGYLYVVDRIKDMIICGGENVFAREVEEVLGAHPAVREVAVIGVPHERLGEEVVAVIVPVEDAGPDQDDLLAFAGQRLAGAKRPRRAIVVTELPRTAIGKVDKPELRRRHSHAAAGDSAELAGGGR